LYTVAITYELGRSPVVAVVAPELILPPATELPHTYEDDALCLHLRCEWTDDMHLALTTVPWTAEWLLHYELWLATGGTWCGGGHGTPPAGGSREN